MGKRPSVLKRGRGRCGGFTMIELAIAMSILMIGLVSAASATMRMHHLRKQNRERIVAQNAARSIAERIHAQSYRFSESPATWSEELLDVFSPGGTFGDTFDASILNSPSEDQELPGQIIFVTDERLTDADLGIELGMPRDLNGDGDANDADVTNDARLLPVVIRITWRGQAGIQQLTHGFFTMGY
ncbi:MAG: prepilin-type N-terminal cleavage/methylation domain-containing protein [Planctomycetota bacterium]